MKKLVTLLLSLALVLSLAACGGEATPDASDDAPASSQNEESTENDNTENQIVFEEVVAIDNAECAVKITEIDPDNMWGYTLKAQLENKSTEKTYMFSVESASINGVQCDPMFASEVAAGKKANEEINFSTDTLEENGIVEYTDIELTFKVYDSNDWSADPVGKETIHVYPYGEENAVAFVREAQATDNVIIDNDYVTVIVTGYEDDEIWGYTANLFLLNKTDKTVMYSKDISKKVHSSYLLKAQKGQFTGCLAPFGYRKDPEDKNHLLIDEETAPIVRLIFGYALNGHGPNYIRRRLEEEKIPCPTWWNRERGLRNTRTKWEKKDPEKGRYMWDFSVIKDLLMNPVYTGAIASQKKDYRFKIGTIGEKKPEDWIVVEGQHEPLIDRMSFDIVQNKLKSRQRPGQTNEISLFAGLIKCGECGKSLTVRYTNAKHPQQIYSCKTYNAFGKNHCTQHRIDYDTLYSHVLRKIRECARAALMDGEAVADRLTNTCEAEQREQREAMERSLTRDEERIEVLDKMVMRLYEDMIAGRISEQNFNTMLEKTQTEQTELKAKVSEGRKRLSDEVQLANDAKQWVEAIQEYANITELDAATLNRLIKEIVVHERIDEDKTRHISIEIHFNLKPIPEVEQVTA